MSEALKKVLTIDLDDSQLKNFYQDLRRQELNIHIEKFIVNEKANDSLMKETEKSINTGIKKGTQKGSDTFQRGFLGKLSLLETQINKSFVKPIEQIQAPINSLFSGLSSLGGIFLGGGAIGSIVSLVGSLTTRLTEFSVANQKFKDSLSSSLEVRGIEYLSKNIENLSKKTNLSRDTISSFLVEMKKMGVASEDATRHMGFLEGILPRIGKVAPENFSKLVGILKSVEEGVKLSSKQLKTLGFLVGEEASQKIQKLGKEGRLTFESFTKTIEEFGRKSSESFSKNIEDLEKQYEKTQKLEKQMRMFAELNRKNDELIYGNASAPFNPERSISFKKDKETLEEAKKELNSLLEKSLEELEVKIRLTPDKEKWQKEVQEIRNTIKENPLNFPVAVSKIKELSSQAYLQYQASQSKPEEDLQESTQKFHNYLSIWRSEMNQSVSISYNELVSLQTDTLKKLKEQLDSAFHSKNPSQSDIAQYISQIQSLENVKLPTDLPKFFDEVSQNIKATKEDYEKFKKSTQEKSTKKTTTSLADSFFSEQEKKKLKTRLEEITRKIQILESLKNGLTKDNQEILLKLTIQRDELSTELNGKGGSLNPNKNSEINDKIVQGIDIGTQALAGLIENIGKRDAVGTGLSVMGSLGQTATALKDMLPGGAIAGAVIGGITGIFSTVDSFMKAGIEREMEGIRKQDALFLDEYKKTKDKEIDERKKHIKELDEQFSKTKSVYDRAFEEGAISSEEYAHHMKGATQGYQQSKKEEQDKIEVATRQKQMLDNYISRREEIQKTKKENERWSFGVEDSESAQKLARINEAINAIQTAKSIEDLNKYPEKAINYAYHGYQGYTNKPTLFMTSELGQKEHVNITPSYRLGEENSPSGVSIGNIEININGSGLSVNELSNELVDALFMRLQQRMQRGMYGGR